MTLPPVAVHDLGGSGPTVLYAHATGFHGHLWKPLTDHLPGLHNIAYDARGHGESPAPEEWTAPDGAIDWRVYGDDATTLATELATDGPIVGVGHSMGGAAMIMAALSAPEAIRGLVLFEPIAMAAADVALSRESGNPNNLTIGARKRRSTFASFEQAIANYASKPPLNEFTPEALDNYVRYGFVEGEDGAVHLRCRPEHEARTFEAAGWHGTWERLGDLTVPVWIVSGLPQEMRPSARARAMADLIPDSRYIELDHLGHFGPMQSPGEIAAIVAAAAKTF